ncbi:MAG: DUF6146 family protein [Gilvibacter sp.]
MKYFLLISFIAIMIFGCGGYSNSSSGSEQDISSVAKKGDTIRIANDSLEYEIIIIEPGFNNWLVTQFPEDYYTQGFLENRNRFLVAEYNRRVLNATQHPRDLYIQQIDYRDDINYGKEVNYLLFMYFKYFQQRYKQKL